MASNIEIHRNRLAQLKSKLAARDGKKEFAKSLPLIEEEIERQQAVIDSIEAGGLDL